MNVLHEMKERGWYPLSHSSDLSLKGGLFYSPRGTNVSYKENMHAVFLVVRFHPKQFDRCGDPFNKASLWMLSPDGLPAARKEALCLAWSEDTALEQKLIDCMTHEIGVNYTDVSYLFPKGAQRLEPPEWICLLEALCLNVLEKFRADPALYLSRIMEEDGTTGWDILFG